MPACYPHSPRSPHPPSAPPWLQVRHPTEFEFQISSNSSKLLWFLSQFWKSHLWRRDPNQSQPDPSK
jgi:hypothetical protein